MKQSLAAAAAMLVLAAAVLTAANTALDATAVPMPYTDVLSHGDAAAAEGFTVALRDLSCASAPPRGSAAACGGTRCTTWGPIRGSRRSPLPCGSTTTPTPSMTM